MILILGYGFLGKSLSNKLDEFGMRHKVFSRNVKSSSKFISGDLQKVADFRGILQGVEMVIHTIHTSFPSSTHSLDKDIQSNLNPLIRLTDAINESKIEKLIYFSSGGALYGESKELKSEDSLLKPVSNYGIMKVLMEQYLRFCQRTTNIKPIIIRPSNVYGVRENHVQDNGIINLAIRASLNGSILPVWGENCLIKDYLYIEDFLKAVFKIITNPTWSHDTYNISSEKSFLLESLLEKIESITQRRINIEYSQAKEFDIREMHLDSKKFQQQFGWEAKTQIDEGLSKLIDKLSGIG